MWWQTGQFRVPQATKRTILLNKEHHLTLLIARDCHDRVMHSGVKATLAELRSKYWIIRGRIYIKKIICRCAQWHTYEGKPYSAPSARVNKARPFSYTGVDFPGPLYVRDIVVSVSESLGEDDSDDG